MRRADREKAEQQAKLLALNKPKKVILEGCIEDKHPQQTEYETDELTLDSCFDSGNMLNAFKVDDLQYNIYIAPDCANTPAETGHRTWFYFRATNIKKFGTYTFVIKNMNFQAKLLNEGLLPVYRSYPNVKNWRKITSQVIPITNNDKGIEISFKHTISVSDQVVYLAFSYPWSYEEDQKLLDHYEHECSLSPDIYFHREIAAFSKENRKIELVTITSKSGMTNTREEYLPNLFPETEKPRPYIFENKKYLFISSRVHPGETPASYVLKGLLKLLCSKVDQRGAMLRENFVFVIIPMLNPDGVYRGHFRSDTQGLNLNRYYLFPTFNDHPSIYAARQILLNLHQSKRLFFYCDLHAHATKKGCFVFGNQLNFRDQVLSRLFPKLLSLNSEYFEYSSSCFSDKNLLTNEKGDGKDKDGAGRVAIYKATGNIFCYTLECNYQSGSIRNSLADISRVNLSKESYEETKLDPTLILQIKESVYPSLEGYETDGFEEIGHVDSKSFLINKGIGCAILDMHKLNPMSRVPRSTYKNLEIIKYNIALNLMKELPFRFDPFIRKVSRAYETNFDVLRNYLETGKQDEVKDEYASTNTAPLKKKPLQLIPVQNVQKVVKTVSIEFPPIVTKPGTSNQKLNPVSVPRSKLIRLK